MKNAASDARRAPASGPATGLEPQPGAAGQPDARQRRRIILKVFLTVVVLAAALVIDLLTKRWAEHNLVLGEVDKVLPFFYLQRTANSGVAFGMFGGNTTLIIVSNLVAMLVICLYVGWEQRPVLAGIAGGAVLGGSIGNFVQRLTADGHVTDFMKFPHWPNFNMADVFIDAGIAAVVIGLIVQAVLAWRATRRQAPSP